MTGPETAQPRGAGQLVARTCRPAPGQKFHRLCTFG